MKHFLSFTLVTLAAFLAGCTYPNQFRNVHRDSPHAVLAGDGMTVMHINDQPTSFWRVDERFRIPAGTNTCLTGCSDWKETIGYQRVQFVALADREYVIARKREPAIESPFTATPHPTTRNAWIIHDLRDRVMIHTTKPNGSDLLVADTPREDYVFGASSSASAIVAYHRKNP